MLHVLQEVTADAVLDHARLGPGPLLLGSGGSADVVLDGDGVSVRHARVGLDAAGPWVRDLGSTDGTRVNGVLAEGRQVLGPDDLVGIGGHLLRVRAPSDRSEAPGPALTEALAALPRELGVRLRAEVMADRWEADRWRSLVADPGGWVDRIDDRDDLVAAIEAQLRAWDVDPGRRRLDDAATLGRLAEGGVAIDAVPER
ncbi:MAG: FHA domain-containing protein, partial [Myxococcota bacterium]